MWLTTEHGFASVVFDKKKQKYSVRFRDIESAKNFATLAGVDHKQLIELPHRDYLFRFYLVPAEWERLMRKLSDFEYTNFKSHCAKTKVWSGKPHKAVLYGIYNAAWDLDDRPSGYIKAGYTGGGMYSQPTLGEMADDNRPRGGGYGSLFEDWDEAVADADAEDFDDSWSPEDEIRFAKGGGWDDPDRWDEEDWEEYLDEAFAPGGKYDETPF